MLKYWVKRINYRQKIRREVIDYYTQVVDSLTDEQKEVVGYLKENKAGPIPHFFVRKYDADSIEVCKDPFNGLLYVMHKGHKLYFKRRWSVGRVKRAYVALLREQDFESPHCYLTSSFTVRKGDVVADVGAAEGIFALEVLNQADHIYLFESDREWMEALNATFADWSEKVTIVEKFVSNCSGDSTITLDSFFDNKKVDFIKVDIEGAEHLLLEGACNLLSGDTSVKIAITTYHKPDDSKTIWAELDKYNYKQEFSRGYMLILADKRLAPPYLRKGLIRASKAI